MFKSVFNRLRVDTGVLGAVDESHGKVTAAPGARELLTGGSQTTAAAKQSTPSLDSHSQQPGSSQEPQSVLAATEQPRGLQSLPTAASVEPALCKVSSSNEQLRQQQQLLRELQQQQQNLQQLLRQSQQQQQQQNQQLQQPSWEQYHDHAAYDAPASQQQQQQQQQWGANALQIQQIPQQPHQGDQLQTIQQLQQKLNLEAKAREELEDMLLRYERQFKAESAARLAAEQKLAATERNASAALSAAADARQQLASNGRQAKQDSVDLAGEQEAVRQERAALERMRQDFEAQLHTARSEVAKAQAAMASNEERLRAVEAGERAQLVMEYEGRLAALITEHERQQGELTMRTQGMAAEIERLRDELALRTQDMAGEMERWKRQATLTAAAVVEAKNEVMERKRELDSTKDKMDTLIEKLYGSREANMNLSGAIAAAANYQKAATNSFLMQQANSLQSMSGGSASFAGGAAPVMMLPYGGIAGQAAAAGFAGSTGYTDMSTISTSGRTRAGSRNNKLSPSRANSGALVPTVKQQQQQQARLAQGSLSPLPSYAAGALLDCTGALQQSQQQQHQYQRSKSSVQANGPVSRIPQPFLASATQGSAVTSGEPRLPSIGKQKAKTEAWNSSKSRSPERTKSGGAGSYAELHQQQVAEGTVSPTAVAGGDTFGHVTSKYAQSAAKYSQARQAKSKQLQKQRGQGKKPDRFAEGAKNAAMITAMAHKWG